MNKILKKIKKNIYFLVIILIILIFGLKIIINKFSITNVEEFLSDDIKVLYISNDYNYSSYVSYILDKYEIKYMYINSDELNNLTRKKIQKLVNSNYLNDIILIYEDGKIIDAKINFETENELNEFFQDNNIIPKVIGSNKDIIADIEEFLTNEKGILYIPYEFSDGIDSTNSMLEQICLDNNINYLMIDGYLLSNTQKEKLNLLLNISEVNNQIIVYLNDNTVVGNLRDSITEENFIEKLYEYKLIIEETDNLNEINIDYIAEFLDLDYKRILLITSSSYKYNNDLYSKLNLISLNDNIEINYIIIDDDSEYYEIIKSYIINLGYSDSYSLPITFILEKNKILDYIIGNSDSEYFIDIFKDNGLIK